MRLIDVAGCRELEQLVQAKNSLLRQNAELRTKVERNVRSSLPYHELGRPLSGVPEVGRSSAYTILQFLTVVDDVIYELELLPQQCTLATAQQEAWHESQDMSCKVFWGPTKMIVIYVVCRTAR